MSLMFARPQFLGEQRAGWGEQLGAGWGGVHSWRKRAARDSVGEEGLMSGWLHPVHPATLSLIRLAAEQLRHKLQAATRKSGR